MCVYIRLYTHIYGNIYSHEFEVEGIGGGNNVLTLTPKNKNI